MISVIACCRDRGGAERLKAAYARFGAAVETIGIIAAESMAAGYQLGMQRARGDHLVFTHDDVEPLGDDLVPRLCSLLADLDLVGVAGTTRLSGPRWIHAGPPWVAGAVAYPHQSGHFAISLYGAPGKCVRNVQALDGLFIASRRDVALELGWDAHTFPGWHLYDLDFSFRAHRAGKRVGITLELPLIHASHGKFDGPWEEAARAFIQKHGAHLAPAPTRKFQLSAVIVDGKPALSAFWNDLASSLQG